MFVGSDTEASLVPVSLWVSMELESFMLDVPGLDISKRDAKVCIRVAGTGGRGASRRCPRGLR